MRITQNMLYGSAINNIQNTLERIQEVKEKDASQKRINRPSDDPSGYAQSRRLNSILSKLQEYSSNIGVAKSWLKQADSTLLQASTVMTGIRELAGQAATGTVTDQNRRQIAQKVRAYFDELLALSNTSVSGNYLFAGQKTGGPAFKPCLNATVADAALPKDCVAKVEGDSKASVLVQFTSSGTVGTDPVACRYSVDGGATWSNATLPAGGNVLALGGVSVTLKPGAQLVQCAAGATSLVVRPSAVYAGDGQDGAAVRAYGSGQVKASADGVFSLNVTVRMDSNASLPGPYAYSYSTDGGLTWSSGHVASGARIPVPGGHLNLGSGAGHTLAAGDQFTIVPHTADIRVNIAPNSEIVINNVGKDIFGGLHQPPGASNASAAFPGQPGLNIFETVGRLIGCLESNDRKGIADCLDSLKSSQAHLETALAGVGSRENRLDIAQNTVDLLRDNAEERLSVVEDADLSQLLIDAGRYQYAYESVLSTSSKIMRMSLLNYL